MTEQWLVKGSRTAAVLVRHLLRDCNALKVKDDRIANIVEDVHKQFPNLNENHEKVNKFLVDEMGYHTPKIPIDVTDYVSDACTSQIERHNSLEFVIGDGLSYLRFISDLRHKLFTRAGECKLDIKVQDRYQSLQYSTQKHPLLRHQVGNVSELGINRWLFIKLVVPNADAETTTIAMRDDNLYICAFRNKDGLWYDLGEADPKSSGMVPTHLFQNASNLRWGTSYANLLLNEKDPDPTMYEGKIVDALKKMLLGQSGKDLMVNSVEVLSAFGVQNRNYNDSHEQNAKTVLAVLLVIISESARMIPFHDYFVRGWEKMTSNMSEDLMLESIWSYGQKSKRLRDWSDQTQTEVLDIVETCLVLNKSQMKN